MDINCKQRICEICCQDCEADTQQIIEELMEEDEDG